MDQLNYSPEQRQRMRDTSLSLFVGLQWALTRLGDQTLNQYDRENVEFLIGLIEGIKHGKKIA